MLNGSTAVQSALPATTRSRTLGWLDISLWTGGRDKQPTADSVEDFEYLEQQPTSPASSSNRTDDRPDDTSSEEGGTLAAGAADENRIGAKSGTGVRANSTTRDPLSSGKRGKVGSSSSWQDRSATAAGGFVLSFTYTIKPFDALLIIALIIALYKSFLRYIYIYITLLRVGALCCHV